MHQPQFERVNLCDVAAVGEAVGFRCVFFIKALQHALREALAGRDLLLQRRHELLVAGALVDVAIHRAETTRRQTHALIQVGLPLRGSEILVALVEAIDEQAPLLVDKACQVGLAQRVAGVVEYSCSRTGGVAGVMADDVAHDADEHQVDGIARRLPHVHHPAVVLDVEVGEMVQSAAGEERLGRRRVLPAHRAVEQVGQFDFGMVEQDGGHPLRQHIALRLGFLLECGLVEFAVVGVQSRNDFQIGHQGAQLGGRAKIEPGLAVDVERLVEVVGLDAQMDAGRRFFIQGEAVDHLGKIVVGPEQAMTDQSRRRYRLGFAKALQIADDLLLCRLVDGGAGLQVEAVEIVELRDAEQRGEAVALRIGGLLFDEAWRRRIDAVGRAAQLDLLGALRQFARNDSGTSQQFEMVVGEGIQRLAVGGEVIRRPAHRDDQRQRMFQCTRIFGVVLPGRTGKCLVERREVDPVPGPQAVADAVDFAKARCGGERYGVEVVHDDAAAHRQGVGSLQIGAQAGGRHLLQFLAHARGQALGRMAVFLDLRRQGAAAGNVAVAVDQADAFFQQGLRQPVPFHRRITGGKLLGQQFAVFDVEQGVDQNFGDSLELVVDP